ncbi:Rieske 2Fe-2S domain-containing protein [Methylocella sp. CPCC 101449]|uniref:Rieske 2Fe-2S domain-containing protein n=1 Tax=Methylocella sp. CPCC 101449 TaxID=2987531 RepID=UPI00288D8510|nr:Rieske 2Fe-2S domain-containing protein [Methylocella sp. CPCC 101449]MDT2023272.1 Rieske 2Fe-2S domain-containing protein [Methylocella sp. CPCC 101449]
MLRHEDNERLTRVGAGTPGGELFRRYWIPALMSSELPENDGAPVRVRLLGEDLIAFRDSNGDVGLVDAFCPHRRAPMFFGRNEECGLRCVYHGWKFNTRGHCVDMPSEPEGSTLHQRVKIKAYPCIDKGGIVWTYMGPKETMPEPPDYEWMRAPITHRHVSKTYEECNYLQAMEGGLDTAHSSFAHNNNLGNRNEPRLRDRSPRLDVERTEYGYCYVSFRDLKDGNYYMRIYHFVMPFQQFRGGIHKFDGSRRDYPELNGHIWVPIDDTTTYVYNWACAYDADANFSEDNILEREYFYGRGPDQMIPGTFQLKANKSNDYFIDRNKQKSETYTGIEGINTQDFALQEGMGPIVDRSLEHLGSSDKAIVAMRRLMLEAVTDVEEGRRPKGADPKIHAQIRPYDGFMQTNDNWKEVFAAELTPRW